MSLQNQCGDVCKRAFGTTKHNVNQDILIIAVVVKHTEKNFNLNFFEGLSRKCGGMTINFPILSIKKTFKEWGKNLSIFLKSSITRILHKLQ